MKLHANAAICPKSGVDGPSGRLSRGVAEEAAEAAGVSERRSRSGSRAIAPRASSGWLIASAPGSVPHRTASERVQAIAVLRRLRMTGAEIAECLGMALSTVSAVLQRIGLGKLSRLEPLEPPNRYERAAAGRAAPHRRQEARTHQRRRPPGHRRRSSQNATRRSAAAASPAAGSSCTSASTTPPASPTSKCSKTRRRPQPSRSSAARSRFYAATASRSSG